MSLALPEPDRDKLPRSPLELVVCQVRFDRQVANSDGKVARAFREALLQGFGEFDQISDVAAGEVAIAVGPGVGQVNQTTLNGWRFGSNETLAAVLMPDHVALETSSYTSWEDFQPRLFHVIDCAALVVDPALEQRVGLRYVDRVSEPRVTTAAAWAPFIRDELLGPLLHPGIGRHVQATLQQIVLDIGDGVMCGFRHGTVPNQENGAVDYVLDYDVYREGGRPFDPAGIKAAIEEFHTTALQLFQESITEALVEMLRTP